MRFGPLPRMTTFVPRRRIGLALLLERAVQVRRERLELRRAGIDALVGRRRARSRGAARARLSSSVAEQPREVAVAEARRASASRSRSSDRSRAPTGCAPRAPARRSAGTASRNQRIDVRQPMDLLEGPAALERAEHRPHPPVGRNAQRLLQRGVVFLLVGAARRASGRRGWPLAAELERAERLQERFLERAADRHRLAHRLHLRRQRAVGLRELLERPARHLDDDVVDRRLERRRRQPRDVVGDLVEAVAERELRRDLRDRESRWPSTRAPTTATRAGSSRSRPSGRPPG